MPSRKLLHYLPAQYLGAFTGAAFLGLYFLNTQRSFGMAAEHTMGIYATYPAPHVTLSAGIWDQIAATGFLLFLVLTVADPRHKIPPFGVALCAGAVVLAVGVCLGIQTGYAINPARDFGPRLFTYAAQWGQQVWTYPGDYQWWPVPLFVPHLGGLLGGVVRAAKLQFTHYVSFSFTRCSSGITSQETTTRRIQATNKRERCLGHT